MGAARLGPPMGRARRLRDEAGDTLVEIVVTVMIMSVAVVGIIAGIASAISLSGLHKSQADVSAALVSAAEVIKSHGYEPCCSSTSQCPDPSSSSGPFAAALQTAGIAAQESDITSLTVAAVTNTAGTACTSVPNDPGIEMVQVRATSDTGKVVQSIYVVVADN